MKRVRKEKRSIFFLRFPNLLSYVMMSGFLMAVFHHPVTMSTAIAGKSTSKTAPSDKHKAKKAEKPAKQAHHSHMRRYRKARRGHMKARDWWPNLLDLSRLQEPIKTLPESGSGSGPRVPVT